MLQYKIPKSKTILHSIPIGSIMVLLLLLSFLVSPNIYYSNNNVYAVEEDNIEGNSEEVADDSNLSTQANVTTASATLSIDNSANGTSYSEPGETVYRTHNVDVHVNDVTSYNLSISYGADANNTLNYEGSSKNPPTITGANNLAGNRLENNTWGYYWDTSNSTDTSTLNYSTMPNYNASETILTESNSNNIAYNKTINGKLIFAAKFAEDAPYGHYKTSVLLSLAATPQNITTYSITYNCNGGSNCPENLSIESTELTYTYTIPNITPTKDGYTFLGYSTSSGSTTVEYNPNSTINLNSASPSMELVAVWKANNPLEDIKNMQDMTSDICRNTSIGASTTLTDSRDGNTYTVAKLDDGKCWMTQNLRIINKKIDSTNSDLAEGATYTIPASSSPWSDTSATTNKVHYAGNTTNGANYTWYTATASTQGSNYSICPRGWKLPSLSEYQDFLTKAGINYKHWNGSSWSGSSSASDSTKIRGAPYNFPYAGFVFDGSLRNVGSEGYYWSSTASGSNNAYRLYFTSSNVNTGTRNRCNGLSVRCIAP